jgi:hypothetical protein
LGKSLQLSLFGIHLNEEGQLVAPNGVVVTKEFLMIALKYRSLEEIAVELLHLTVEELVDLLDFFQIDHKKIISLTPQRIKIMEVTQRYMDRYGELPSLKYLKARTKMQMKDLEKELKVLTTLGYIKYSHGKGIEKLLRAV